MTTYITIDNTDNKLSQQEWSAFITDIVLVVLEDARMIHIAAFSHPSAPYQNAVWALDFEDAEHEEHAKESAGRLARKYRQESIAWATAQVEFI